MTSRLNKLARPSSPIPPEIDENVAPIIPIQVFRKKIFQESTDAEESFYLALIHRRQSVKQDVANYDALLCSLLDKINVITEKTFKVAVAHKAPKNTLLKIAGSLEGNRLLERSLITAILHDTNQEVINFLLKKAPPEAITSQVLCVAITHKCPEEIINQILTYTTPTPFVLFQALIHNVSISLFFKIAEKVTITEEIIKNAIEIKLSKEKIEFLIEICKETFSPKLFELAALKKQGDYFLLDILKKTRVDKELLVFALHMQLNEKIITNLSRMLINLFPAVEILSIIYEYEGSQV